MSFRSKMNVVCKVSGLKNEMSIDYLELRSQESIWREELVIRRGNSDASNAIFITYSLAIRRVYSAALNKKFFFGHLPHKKVSLDLIYVIGYPSL